MSSQSLSGKLILIAEDEALVAMDLLDLVEHKGGTAIGPCSTVEACHLAIRQQRPHAAILDVRLGTSEVYTVAEELARNDVPIVFHSGHADSAAILARFPNSRFCAKPASETQIIDAITGASNGQPGVAAE